MPIMSMSMPLACTALQASPANPDIGFDVWLLPFLQEAVRVLDSHLESLCRQQSPARVLLQQKQAQAALARVTALSGLFPDSHPFQEAGGKLSAVCKPLLVASDSAARNSLLDFCFRVLRELEPAPRHRLQDCVLAHLQVLSCGSSVAPGHDERLASFARQLALLRVFLDGERQDQAAEVRETVKPQLPRRARSVAVLRPQSIDAAPSLYLSSLDSLLHGEYALRVAVQMRADTGQSYAYSILEPFVRQHLETIAQQCRHSDLSLGYFCASGLARLLQQVRYLLLFCAEVARSQALAEIAAALLWLHLVGPAAEAATLQALLRQLFLVTDKRSSVARQHSVESSPARPGDLESLVAAELHAVMAAEIGRYRSRLLELLPVHDGQPATSGGEPLRILYKLAWVCDAAGLTALATLCASACQLCAQYWFLGKPWSTNLIALMRQVPGMLMVEPAQQVSLGQRHCQLDCRSHGQPHCRPPCQLGRLQWRLLQEWPQDMSDGKLPIALFSGVADSTRIVHLQAVPALLSASFATLVKVSRDWFEQPLPAGQRKALLQELALLEKGAAAMKVWPLEQLCTLLLELYAVNRRADTAPGALLWKAHEQLIRLLDQAAAWQETQADGALVQRLQLWLDQHAGTQEVPPAVSQVKAMAIPVNGLVSTTVISTPVNSLVSSPVKNPLDSLLHISENSPEGSSESRWENSSENSLANGDDSLAVLHQRLRAYVKILAAVIEKPVRLHFAEREAPLIIESGAPLPLAALEHVEDCLKPLLKFMLLDSAADAQSRRAVHKPRITTLGIDLHRTQVGLQIAIFDDSHAPALTPVQMQQLQKRLPKTSGPLSCEAKAGQGRSFSLMLSF